MLLGCWQLPSFQHLDMSFWGPLGVILSVAASVALWAAAEVEKLDELKKKQKQINDLIALKERAKAAASKLEEERLLRVLQWNAAEDGSGLLESTSGQCRSVRQLHRTQQKSTTGPHVPRLQSYGFASENSFVLVQPSSADHDKRTPVPSSCPDTDTLQSCNAHDRLPMSSEVADTAGMSLSQTEILPLPGSGCVPQESTCTVLADSVGIVGSAQGSAVSPATPLNGRVAASTSQALTLADFPNGQLCLEGMDQGAQVAAASEQALVSLQQELAQCYPRTHYSAPLGFKALTRRQLGHANKYAMAVQQSHKKRQVAGRKHDGKWVAEPELQNMAVTRYRTHSSKDDFQERRREAATSYGHVNTAADVRRRHALNSAKPQFRADEWEHVPVRNAQDLERVVLQALKEGKRVFQKQVVGDATRFTWVAG